MNKFTNYCVGVVKEAKRIRWPKGKDFTSHIAKVFSYIIFFALWLVLCDLLVSQLLQWVNFN